VNRFQHRFLKASKSFLDKEIEILLLRSACFQQYSYQLGANILSAQSFDLKVQLAGRIARAAAIFCVDEIIIFDDGEKVSHHNPPMDELSP